MAQRALILGAAGRDFHNFNTYFRDNLDFDVVAFTAAQIPDIDGRTYPAKLSGPRYPDGIPIEAEENFERLVRDLNVDVVVFSYSDVSHEQVMHLGSRAIAAGADYLLLGSKHTMVKSVKPLIAVCAARTGSGKSQTSRRIAEILTAQGKKVVVIRHPMPYGDLAAQAVQRFETYDDLEKHEVTIEEREEYEPHIAEQEADVVIWDGGNNDLSFYEADLYITVVDSHRPDHSARYHPGEANVRLADVIVINKVGTASLEQVQTARAVAHELNPDALVIEAASPLFVEGEDEIRGKKVLVVEDGPTLTHGEMAYGAGWVAARRYGAAEIIDPRPWAVGSIARTFEKYPNTGPVLPAMGYGAEQTAELQQTIAATPADLVVIGTPIDLRRLIEIDKPSVRVRYELQEIGRPTLSDVLAGFGD